MKPSEPALLRKDPYLAAHAEALRERLRHVQAVERRLVGPSGSLDAFATGHLYFGLHRTPEGWVLREWAPAATRIALVGDASGWEERDRFLLHRVPGTENWELAIPGDDLPRGSLYRLRVRWPGGAGDRIPSYATRVVQDPGTGIFNAQVRETGAAYPWRHDRPPHPAAPLIYEAHVGMAQEKEAVGTYEEFRRFILPRVARAGYNTLQLMAIQEHPYYGSFGYHVSSFFAPSSRFGTPEEFKALVDEAHGMGLRVVMDLVHSHAAVNEVEGLSRFDGTLHQYFHEGPRGVHEAWGSRCFDYGKPQVLHFLLSNCRYWLEEYRLDGFRFDGITSMLYRHHGLNRAFGDYAEYFGDAVDPDALAYLTLSNKLIHRCVPSALTIAEDVSGMPGLAAPLRDGGCGFDCRLAMGVPDCWFKLAGDVPDEHWDLGHLWHELTNRRPEERTISYVESHDQALVGGKTMIFKLMDSAMYWSMAAADRSPAADRAMALHKLMRLATLGSADAGYLNFMGNEFGHPEWIDFPREGNGWSYRHAQRRWSLRDSEGLKFRFLAEFDQAMTELAAQHSLLAAGAPRLLRIGAPEKVLAFARGDVFFFLNFHPDRSLADYAIEAPPGSYRWLMDTDEPRFGGTGRIQPGQTFFTAPVLDSATLRHSLRLYLPCRTAVVLVKSA